MCNVKNSWVCPHKEIIRIHCLYHLGSNLLNNSAIICTIPGSYKDEYQPGVDPDIQKGRGGIEWRLMGMYIKKSVQLALHYAYSTVRESEGMLSIIQTVSHNNTKFMGSGI